MCDKKVDEIAKDCQWRRNLEDADRAPMVTIHGAAVAVSN